MGMRYEPLEQPSGISVWLLATRLQFLTITALAVLLGTAIAIFQQYEFNWLTFTLALIAATLIHGGADVLNDYYDDLSSADKLSNTGTIVVRLGPDRAAQLYPLWAAGAALILLTLVLLDLLPGLVLCALLPLPLVWKNAQDLRKDHTTHQGLIPVVKGTIAIHGMVTGLMILTLTGLSL